MNKPIIIALLLLSAMARAQVTYNKRATGSIGTVPKAADFLNNASLENVDMSTGTLKIAIPIYEIKVNDISVPITINYSATGLKAGQEAGLPGMGWELSAGGKIITNVQGKPDHNTYGMDQMSYPSSIDLSNPTHVSMLKFVLDGHGDSAWDTYNYILPNGGGTFTKNGLTYPYDPSITIDHEKNITTTDGLVHKFISGDHKKSTKLVFNLPNNSSYFPQGTEAPNPTDWFDYDLYQIISTRFKDTVKFGYSFITPVGPGIPRLVAKSRTSTSESLPLYRVGEGVMSGGSFTPNSDYYSPLEPMLSKSRMDYLSHSVLQNVTFPNGKVTFEYYDDVLGRDVLKSIKIFKVENGVDVMLKKYFFMYDENQTYGHYLNALREYDDNDALQHSWLFTYWDKMPTVPGSNPRSADIWGFYNGQTANRTLLSKPNWDLSMRSFLHLGIPSTDIKFTRAENEAFYGSDLPRSLPDGNGVRTYTMPYANRLYSFVNAKLGLLKTISIPTGATYEYDYEPHKYRVGVYNGVPGSSSYQNVIEEGGGIRIKSIIKRRGREHLYYGANTNEANIKKIFLYGEGEQNAYSANTYTQEVAERNGVGQVTVPWYVMTNLSAYYDPWSSSGGTYSYIRNLMLLSHPINNLSQINGSSVMYKSVAEVLLKDESSNDTHGKTVYYNHLANGTPFRVADGVFPNAPYFEADPGITPVSVAGITGINKYAYIGSDQHRLVEYTHYVSEVFTAPENVALPVQKSFYAALTGQLHGLKPGAYTGGSHEYDPPVTMPNGNYVFNAVSNKNLGYMDYLTKTNYLSEDQTMDYPQKYLVRGINFAEYAQCVRRTNEDNATYNINGQLTSVTNTSYIYGNPKHFLPTKIIKIPTIYYFENWVPHSDTVITRMKYPHDYSAPGPQLTMMRDSKIGMNEPIEVYTTSKPDKATTEKLVSGNLNLFGVHNNMAVPSHVYKMHVTDTSTVGGIPNSNDMPTYLAPFDQEVAYDHYVKGQVHVFSGKEHANADVIMWGYNNQHAVAKVTNTSRAIDGPLSTSANVAYTSFETGEKGNWAYSGTPENVTAGISGKKMYNLANGAVTKATENISGKFILSYWYRSGATVNVSGGTIGAAQVKNTWANWTLVEREVTNLTGTLTLSGSGYIDELRFHPANSQMTTYTYEPMIGLSGSIDAVGRAQFYEYDRMQRLKQVTDQDGNTVKAYKYIIGAD